MKAMVSYNIKLLGEIQGRENGLFVKSVKMTANEMEEFNEQNTELRVVEVVSHLEKNKEATE